MSRIRVDMHETDSFHVRAILICTIRGTVDEIFVGHDINPLEPQILLDLHAIAFTFSWVRLSRWNSFRVATHGLVFGVQRKQRFASFGIAILYFLNYITFSVFRLGYFVRDEFEWLRIKRSDNAGQGETNGAYSSYKPPPPPLIP